MQRPQRREITGTNQRKSQLTEVNPLGFQSTLSWK